MYYYTKGKMMKKNRGVFFGEINVVVWVCIGVSLFQIIGLPITSLQATESLDSLQINVNPSVECQVTDSQKIAVSPLGKNLTARLGSWASMGFLAAMSSFLTYKSFEQVFDTGISYIPFLRSYRQETAKIAALTMAFPLSIAILMKYGSLSNYFFYILYSGERVSPLLARDALHDVRVYVEHLQTIKNVQKELNEVIDQINALALQKKNDSSSVDAASGIDAHILVQLDQAIKHDDDYLQAVLAQLQLFLSWEEINHFMQERSFYRYSKSVQGYCVAPELQGQTQAIITQLQSTAQGLGDDALVLNNLMKGLVDYWQNYTVALADGINAALRFCNEVYVLEQIITKWFDRPLLCA